MKTIVILNYGKGAVYVDKVSQEDLDKISKDLHLDSDEDLDLYVNTTYGSSTNWMEPKGKMIILCKGGEIKKSITP